METRCPQRFIQLLAQQVDQPTALSAGEISGLEKSLKEIPTSWGFHSWMAFVYLKNNIDLNDWDQGVREQFLANEWRVATMEKELHLLIQKLEEAHFEYAFLKGIWMAKNILPYKGLRSFGDVDIWVSERGYKNIESFLKSQGFIHRDLFHHIFHFHMEWRKKVEDSHLIFEIHKSLALNDFFKFDHKEIWEKAKRSDKNSKIEFQVEHQLVYIFCHNAIHGFDRPSRLMDLPVLYNWAIQEGFNWDKVMEILSDWNCRKLFLFSLTALEWLLERKIKSHLFETKEQEIVKKVFATWLKGLSTDEPSNRHQRRWQLTDNLLQAYYGFFHPKRIMGALVDRLGIH